jgi:hypothetical protein
MFCRALTALRERLTHAEDLHSFRTNHLTLFSIKNKLLSFKSSFKMEEGRFAKRIGLVEVSKPTEVIPIRFGHLLEM